MTITHERLNLKQIYILNNSIANIYCFYTGVNATSEKYTKHYKFLFEYNKELRDLKRRCDDCICNNLLDTTYEIDNPLTFGDLECLKPLLRDFDLVYFHNPHKQKFDWLQRNAIKNIADVIDNKYISRH